MTYRCIFRSAPLATPEQECSQDRHLNVPASDVPGAIAQLGEQMDREGEKLTKLIAVGPAHLFD